MTSLPFTTLSPTKFLIKTVTFFTFITYLFTETCTCTSETTPKLTLTPTQDLSLVCNMSGFERNMEDMVGLQVLGRFGFRKDQEIILATVTRSSGAVRSEFLKLAYPMSMVTGEILEKGEKFHSWIKLTIANADYSQFECQDFYLEKKSDSNSSSWRSAPANYVPDTSTYQANGMSMSVEQGLAMECGFMAKFVSDIIGISIVSKGEGLTLVSWSEKSVNDVYCTDGVVCEPLRSVANYYSLRAHLMNISCLNEGDFLCRVEMSTQGNSTSTEEFGLNECRGDSFTQIESPENVTTDESHANDKDCESCNCKLEHVFIAVLAIACLGIITAVIVNCKCKRKTSEHNKAPDENAYEDGINILPGPGKQKTTPKKKPKKRR